MPKPQQIFTDLARAKINLTLHVGAVQADGYHPLRSLVVFADIGDELTAIPAEKFNLKIDGPFACGLGCENDNLILRAARRTYLQNGLLKKSAYTLTKNLPISSGIGGGSADAAAAIRLLWKINGVGDAALDSQLAKIGADVPVCYRSQTCIMEGVGEKIIPLPGLGQLHAVLVNPGVGVSTGEIFKAFDTYGKSSDFHETGKTLLEMEKPGTNDLQDIAIKTFPVIQAVIDEISVQNGCEFAQMSGSGATCFGVYASTKDAKNAENSIKEKHPNWWCVQAMLGDIP